MAESLSIQRLDAGRRDDFYRFHCPANDAGWCFCVAWWAPTWEGWGDRSADDNRRLRDELFDHGEFDGYLAYAGDEPVGWCQVGPRDRLTKLAQQFALPPDPAVWAITCVNVAPSRRRRGVARTLLRAVLDGVRARGVRRLEAFPKRGPELEPGDLWNGPEALYREAGFSVTRDDPQRPLLALDL